jgi:serine/threonine-protein kinase
VINGQKYARVFGGSVPAPIWAEFMSYVTKDLPVSAFPADPANIDDYLKPPATNVPSVVGLTEKDAKIRLIEAKLNVSVELVPSLEPEGIVVAQSRAAGSSVPQGSFVTIFVSSGETPKGTLPSFVGMTPEEAIEAARLFEEETGVKLSLFNQKVDVADPQLAGKVVSMTPNGGTPVEGQASVTLFIGQVP